MPSAVCGWCDVHSNMTLRESVGEFPDDDNGGVWGLYQCNGCGCCSMGHAYAAISEVDHAYAWGAKTSISFAQILQFYADKGELTWYPASGSTIVFEHIPEHVAEAAQEAKSCLGAGHRRAAVQLARSVVEATAKDKGVTIKGIKAKIDAMFDQRLIREHIRDGAHEVRYLGNDMAHGDFTESVASEDAGMVLQLMHELLVEVYESPGRVQQVKDRRAAREAARQA